jgi:hypothetical protein
VGIVVLAFAAIAARSIALAGFGLDSLIEIGASTLVLWDLAAVGENRRRSALRLIGAAFLALAIYLAVQSASVLIIGSAPIKAPGDRVDRRHGRRYVRGRTPRTDPRFVRVVHRWVQAAA